jgi:hypothetical protein
MALKSLRSQVSRDRNARQLLIRMPYRAHVQLVPIRKHKARSPRQHSVGQQLSASYVNHYSTETYF